MAFVPIARVVDKVIEKSVEFVPVIGPGLKYIKTAKKVNKFANPVKATTYTAGMLLEICGAKYAKYSALCTVWATTTTAGFLTGNPALIAVGAQFGNMVIDDISFKLTTSDIIRRINYIK